MALNDQVKFTWGGHGTWRIRTAAGKEVLIDPWLTGNPVAPEHLQSVERLDVMVITHGHFDHTGDAVAVAKATGCKIVCPFEIGAWLGREGVGDENVVAMDKGGTA